MQVNPDANVRVNQAGSMGRIPVSPEYASDLSNGDILVAAVEQVRGDMLLLRLESGALLNAAQQGDMQLTQGDVIEAAVSKDGETCLLYILNILRAGAQSPKDAAPPVPPRILSAMLSVIKRNPGLDADIALFLAENGIPDTAENIAALSQMSRGTGIGALLGQVLGLAGEAAQSSPGGAQSPAPAGETPLPQGETPAKNPNAATKSGQSQPVSAAAGETPLKGTQTQGPVSNPQTAADGTTSGAPGMAHTVDQEGTAVPIGTRETGAVPQAVSGKQGAVPASQGGEPTGAEGAGQSAAPQAQPGAAGTLTPHTAPPQDAAGMPKPQAQTPQGAPPHTAAVSREADGNTQVDGRTMAAPPAVQGQSPQSGQAAGVSPAPAPPGQPAVQPGGPDPGAVRGTAEHIGKMIMDMFYEPQTEGGDGIKRTAGGISRSLKTLKSELVQTDIKYRELCLKTVDQAVRQMEMADRAARFEHMQIPFAVKEGEHRTAELYVFRRKNGQKPAGEAGLSILVALDTDHMGRVETLIREEGGSISLEFRLQEPGMAEAFKQHSGPLKEAVETAGYRLKGMRFSGLEKKTTVLNAGEMASMDAGSAPHGIDVQI